MLTFGTRTFLIGSGASVKVYLQRVVVSRLPASVETIAG